MTERLIDHARRRPGIWVPPVVAIVMTLVLAYGGILWMNVLHRAEGVHELNEPGWLVHWLRDATLALPIVLAGVWAGLLLCRRLVTRLGGEPGRVCGTALVAVICAATASAAVGLANPLHATAFGHHHAVADLPWPLHMARDALAAFTANVILAVVVAAVMARRHPWRAPAVERWALPEGRSTRTALRTGLAAVLIAPAGVVAATGAQLAVAGPGPGFPCPGSAHTVKFDVQAIDVNIPLNRFGDHDPLGKMYVLTEKMGAVRAEEKTQHVSIGLRNDAIQPLVIRANEGDCVEITFTNSATGGNYGMHIDGLVHQTGSSGDAIGTNTPSSVAKGFTTVYRYYLPDDPNAEGLHYIRPGPGFRDQVSHGLFGALAVEPPGSTYSEIETGRPITSGWEANVMPGDGRKAFREYAQLYHEVGNEDYRIPDARGNKLPRVDPHTDSYRPAARAMNYRSEPFMHRLDRNDKQESLGYSSYPFGDPATPLPRGYQGDPTKIRILHAGSEMFHVFHLHGGGIRWRFNPVADTTYDYQDTGLDKHPKTQLSPSTRLDSQAFGPGESYNLEIEGGAGGVQQGAGEFLFHCHIAEHYISGMWSFWRVYDTHQPDLSTLPDRDAKPDAVPAAKLIGTTIHGSDSSQDTTITRDNLDDWIRPQLPPAGVPLSDQDAAVWDWKVAIDTSDTANPVPHYLGAPEDRGPWPDLLGPDDWKADPTQLKDHPGLYPVDTVPSVGGNTTRPEILFDPTNGRPAYPLLRPQIGDRNPFSPNGHSGAPWLGETGDRPKPSLGVDPYANRRDGICPAGATVRHFNVVAIQLPIQVTQAGGLLGRDPDGKIYVLAHDKDDVLAGRKPAQPLAIRGNIGDCIAVTLTNEQRDTLESPFTKVNMHIHHVQFDTQASDGVITGLSFEQSIRPHTIEDPALTGTADAGALVLPLSSTAKFQDGEFIAVGQGTESIEVRRITSHDASTVTLDRPLDKPHAAGQGAGTEFTQYRWYPDVQLDNIFWHDHVDGIHAWGHGLVGQFIVEPLGSTYHDPRTGAQVDSGTIVDIHTPAPGNCPDGSNPTRCQLAPGLVTGSFRELALWTLDENPITDSTLNLRAVPFNDRHSNGNDPSVRFSSYKYGDPNTPLPLAYADDPFVIRTVNVGPSVDTLHVDGHRFFTENRFLGADGKPVATPTDGLTYGISERYTAIMQGGAGKPGDYLYMNGLGRRFRQGAWGIIRVLPGASPDLKPLPDRPAPAAGPPLPKQTGNRPPVVADPGNPCPPGAPLHSFAVSAVDLPSTTVSAGHRAIFVPTADAAAVKAGSKNPEPLVLHVSAGECVKVRFTNGRLSARASFHVSKLMQDVRSSGIDVGFNPEQTVTPGKTRDYAFYADTGKLGSALISDFGAEETGDIGLYGAIVVAPSGSAFSDPTTGAPTDVGSQVDVKPPGERGYRDFALLFADNDERIGGSFMPYPTALEAAAMINYRNAGARGDDTTTFSSIARGDPATPLLRAYAGDRVKVHALGTPGSEQIHVLSLGGQTWRIDDNIPNSDEETARALGPWQSLDTEIIGGAGGVNTGGEPRTGDVFYGDIRRPFTTGGMWGLMRVYPAPQAEADLRPLG
jgi:FtsP/CotA-like multicopper oxidase with cupredoxin domain